MRVRFLTEDVDKKTAKEANAKTMQYVVAKTKLNLTKKTAVLKTLKCVPELRGGNTENMEAIALTVWKSIAYAKSLGLLNEMKPKGKTKTPGQLTALGKLKKKPKLCLYDVSDDEVYPRKNKIFEEKNYPFIEEKFTSWLGTILEAEPEAKKPANTAPKTEQDKEATAEAPIEMSDNEKELRGHMATLQEKLGNQFDENKTMFALELFTQTPEVTNITFKKALEAEGYTPPLYEKEYGARIREVLGYTKPRPTAQEKAVQATAELEALSTRGLLVYRCIKLVNDIANDGIEYEMAVEEAMNLIVALADEGIRTETYMDKAVETAQSVEQMAQPQEENKKEATPPAPKEIKVNKTAETPPSA